MVRSSTLTLSPLKHAFRGFLPARGKLVAKHDQVHARGLHVFLYFFGLALVHERGGVGMFYLLGKPLYAFRRRPSSPKIPALVQVFPQAAFGLPLA